MNPSNTPTTPLAAGKAGSLPEELLTVVALHKEQEAADVIFLLERLGIKASFAQCAAIASFRRQIWNVAAQEAWEAAINAYTAPAAGDGEPKINLLAGRLAGAELNYRDAYEKHGGSHIETGRKWDKMRKAGDAIRAHLDELERDGSILARHCPAPGAREGALEVLDKIATWMERQAAHDEAEASKPNQFITLKEAYTADAKNYRAMAKEARVALKSTNPKPDSGGKDTGARHGGQ